jgi:hypothetical protein
MRVKLKTMTAEIKALCAAAAFAAAFSIFATPASAGTIGDAPWCAVQNLGEGDMIWDCEFQSAEQCQPAVVAGNRGFCNLNPRWTPPLSGPPLRHHYTHHHHYRG